MSRKGANNTYWGNIREGLSSLLEGLKLSWKHLLEARQSRTPIGIADEHYFDQKTGIVTLQYPFESFPVPDIGRYRLHNEIEDCIVCDKCAKICPVDCIEIEPVRAIEEIGKTSDGSSKRIYAAKFDIDMGKCCFCGLCTTVCPTECLTMTKDYDFSEYDVADHNFSFSEMTPLEILEKKKELEAYNQKKEEAKATKKPADDENTGPVPTVKSVPGYRPKVKPVVKAKPAEDMEKPAETQDAAETPESSPRPKPVYRPKAMPVIKKKEQTDADAQEMAKKIMENIKKKDTEGVEKSSENKDSPKKP